MPLQINIENRRCDNVQEGYQQNGTMIPDARQRLSALNSLLSLSAGEATLDEKLSQALDLVLRVTWVPAKQKGAIFLVDDACGLSMRACQGFTDDMRAGCSQVPQGECVCGKVAAMGREVFVRSDDPEYGTCFLNAPNYARYGVPIMAGSKMLGVIVQYVENESIEDNSGTEFMRAVASTLAGIIQRMNAEDKIRILLQKNQLLTRRLMAVQEEDYKRIARELHDELGQSVTAIKADAVLISKHSRDARAEDVNRWATSIMAVADHIYSVIYAAIRRLRPSTLDELGLVAAVDDLLVNWRQRYPWLHFNLETCGNLDFLSESINIAIYRIIQECLVNACRHAAASNVVICLEKVSDVECHSAGNTVASWVVVTICDDGHGMDVGTALSKADSFGLLGMRERIEGLGGDMLIESEINKGTRVIASIPTGQTI